MERGDLTAVYCIGENPVQSEADQARAEPPAREARLPGRPGPVPDEDRRRSPMSSCRRGGLGRERGHRHQLRAPRAARSQGGRADPAGRATTSPSSSTSPAGWATTGESPAETVWDEVRRLSPVHAGMSYARLRSSAASSGRATTRRTRASCSCTRACGRTRLPGNRVPFVPVDHDPPVDRLDADFPIRLTHRPPPRLVQHGRPDRRLHLTPPARREPGHQLRGRREPYGLADGERVAGRLAPGPGRGPGPDRPRCGPG